MGESTRRDAQRVGLAALALVLALPGAARAVSPAALGATPLFDLRATAAAPAAAPPGSPQARARDARAALRRQFGDGVALGIDPATGTTRTLQRLDGALTGPAGGPRAAVARSWLRSQRALLGLDAATVDALAVDDQSTEGPSGLTRVRFGQRYRGLDVFDGGVQVTLDRGGRVLAAAGAPLTDPAIDSVSPQLDAAAAGRALEAATGPGDAVEGVAPDLVVFGAPGGARLAWHLLRERSSTITDDAVVDATSGRVLFRQNLTKSDAPGRVYPSFPGAEDDPNPERGAANAPQAVDLEAAGYLPAGATTLSGPYAHAFSDIDDNDTAYGSEEVNPRNGGFVFDLTPFACGTGGGLTGPRCIWDPGDPETALVNRRPDTVQAFALANRFHDHLLGRAIGFDGRKGFAGVDAVEVQTFDGARPPTGGGPDADHLNNANMTVLPGNLPPKMQMYLFGAPYRAIDGGDDAATVWHEYTHGLSGRLVTRPDGYSALSSVHAGALGEGWSDFYALDKLDRDGLQPDDPTVAGDVDIGRYSDLVAHQTRTMGADCPVAPTPAFAVANGDPPQCAPSGAQARTGLGGYTLGDLGRIDAGGAEVHADGEIWLQTLWDLRRALITQLGSTEAGSDAAERLVTEGMRLSPPEPSFLDERNAILAADTAAGGMLHPLLWQVFARRGMGWYAGVRDATDTKAVEDFHLPPAGGPTGTVSGRVTDGESGLPLAGVRVGPSAPDGAAPSATTRVDGSYDLTLPIGSYARIGFRGAPGFDEEAAATVGVTAGARTTVDSVLHRDWASAAGGGSIENDPRGSCGPSGLLDESGGSDWSAGAGGRTVTIVLPATINVTGIGMDPAAGCGDAPAAALSQYSIDAIRPDGSSASLRSGTFLPTDAGRLNVLSPAGNAVGVAKLRLTLRSSQGASAFIDLAALSVYGYADNAVPAGVLVATPNTVNPAQDVTFDASSFRDADSQIAAYDWDFDADGTIDRTTSEATTVSRYPTPGARVARVTVRDVRNGAGQASAPIQVNDPAPPAAPATTPAPAPTPNLQTVPDPVPSRPTVTPPPTPAPTVRIAATGRRGATSATVTCASRCSVRATGTVSATVARRLERRAAVLTLRRTIPGGPAPGRIALALSKASRASARRAGVRSVTVAVVVRATDAEGRSALRRTSVRIAL